MTATYVDLAGNPLVPQAPTVSGIRYRPSPVAPIGDVKSKDVAEWIAAATPDDVLDALAVEEASDTPRKTVVAALRAAASPPVVTSASGSDTPGDQ